MAGATEFEHRPDAGGRPQAWHAVAGLKVERLGARQRLAERVVQIGVDHDVIGVPRREQDRAGAIGVDVLVVFVALFLRLARALEPAVA